jgi:hypothetical protein
MSVKMECNWIVGILSQLPRSCPCLCSSIRNSGKMLQVRYSQTTRHVISASHAFFNSECSTVDTLDSEEKESDFAASELKREGGLRDLNLNKQK